MRDVDSQNIIVEKLDQLAAIAQELMDMAVTGQDGNLNEMSYHIKCYSKKIITHLAHEWRNNAIFEARKEEKKKHPKKRNLYIDTTSFSEFQK